MTQLLQRQAQTIYHAITQRQNENRENTPILIAIDGRCASGKTTLAAMVQKLYGSKNCDVLHMDDFFLRPHQRTRRRLLQPGGNIDLERFWNEVLRFATDGKPFTYRPYDCKSNQFRPERLIRPKRYHFGRRCLQLPSQTMGQLSTAHFSNGITGTAASTNQSTKRRRRTATFCG